MNYPNTLPGIFLQRRNRFVADVKIGGAIAACHVKNTGRCRELLVPGAAVWCQRAEGENRKTGYTLLAVQKGENLVNLDSQAPNTVAAEWVAAGGLGWTPTRLQREVRFGHSRLDLYYECGARTGWIEVKGVTLEEHDVARFPDAPTERGARHMRELIAARAAGYEATALFVVQMANAARFEPNWPQDAAFCAALRAAAQAGVQVLAVGCAVTPDSLRITKQIPVVLESKCAEG